MEIDLLPHMVLYFSLVEKFTVFSICEIWQKSSETGNAVHELTTLLSSLSHNLILLLCNCWVCVKWSCVCEMCYENGLVKICATLSHQIVYKALQICYRDLSKVTNGVWRTFPIQDTSVQMAQGFLKDQEEEEDKPHANLQP